MARIYPSTLCLLLLAALPLICAHVIEVGASKKECFFEDLHVNDKMTVTYQVGGGGHLDIDFWLTDPTGNALAKQIKQSTGSASITAKRDGRHEYCFSNQMSAIADKLVSFNVHGVLYVGEEGTLILSTDTVAPIEREIRDLANGLKSVKDEQEYIVVRERRHRNTAESTNARVKWWSVFQAVVLFSVAAWQVYYLKSFFETKRAF
ncbi:supernatant protein factor C-terminal domain-containing protein [Punctularia strigosozonata HHB-11173 SS5]|uniref:supernatant protein factor C-terminal domain-containing protein n=1 Tax=Punctularia strigosozonata (strain HHB-11173) TaxID=741275 RepID=UPI00044179E9|nr:supernatant protein factor C-terminal domain-containing protein [Punctularia strigosozonata HHB-11173 SS5]EIN10802.1 supernatant protein factor C-terminal domain-containing protein [Punctularia strigosozonata HHB-11173 SS5]